MSVSIGSLRLGTPMVLAPMAGVTNAAFRHICIEMALAGLRDAHVSAPERQYASDFAPAGLFVNEMVIARALVEGNRHSYELLKPAGNEPLRSIQLHGTDPETMARATEIVIREGAAHIDLNFGCPVPKVTRRGGGAALPWKTGHFARIVAAVVTAARAADSAHPVPVTVKLRVGIDANHLTFIDAARAAIDSGAAAVCLHARTANQYYSGQADWARIAELVAELAETGVAVFGNGDIWTAGDAVQMLRESGCAGVEIGRGVQGNPWLLRDTAAALRGMEPAPRTLPTLREVLDVLNHQAELHVRYTGDEPHALEDMRKHIGWYLRGFPVGGAARSTLNRVGSLAELRAESERLLQQVDPETRMPVETPGHRGRGGTTRRTKLPEHWLDSRDINDVDVIRHAELDASDTVY